MIELSIEMIAALIAGQFIMAAVGVLIGYRLLEINWTAGFVGSIAYGLTVLYAQWYFGSHVWKPGLIGTEVVELIIASITGAILGVMTMISIFEPETTNESPANRRDSDKTTTRSADDNDVNIPKGLGEE